jgi:hypothetical protein
MYSPDIYFITMIPWSIIHPSKYQEYYTSKYVQTPILYNYCFSGLEQNGWYHSNYRVNSNIIIKTVHFIHWDDILGENQFESSRHNTFNQRLSIETMIHWPFLLKMRMTNCWFYRMQGNFAVKMLYFMFHCILFVDK